MYHGVLSMHPLPMRKASPRPAKRRDVGLNPGFERDC
jgi:hypothetical protein